MADALDRDEIARTFHEAVNMTASQLETWLDTDESREVGWKGEDGDGPGESVGHESGRKIVKLLHTKKDDLTPANLEHMRKVSGYVARHMKQKPAHPEESRWRYSLMNWGHDPMKKG